MVEIKRIFMTKPNPKNTYATYENKLQPRILFGSQEMEALFEADKDKIMKRVESEIAEYINTDDLCGDGDMFPRRCALTGEWYLREINFQEMNFLSISTAFLGKSPGHKDDYLGLEVVFYYDTDAKEFRLDGVNSESI